MTRRVASSTTMIRITPKIMSQRERSSISKMRVSMYFVVEKQVEDRGGAEHEQRIVKQARRLTVLRDSQAIEQEDERQREQQMHPAEQDRFGCAEADDPHVIDDHRDGDDRRREPYEAGVAALYLNARICTEDRGGTGAERAPVPQFKRQFVITVMPASL